jgi:hypothetical protein
MTPNMNTSIRYIVFAATLATAALTPCIAETPHPFVEITSADIARIEKALDSRDPWANSLYDQMRAKAITFLNNNPPVSDARDAGTQQNLYLARNYLDIFRTFGAMYLLDSNSSDPNKKANAMIWVTGATPAGNASGIRGTNGARAHLQNLLQLTNQPNPTVTSYHFFEPSHFLATAQAIHAISLAYDWFYPVWTAQEKTAILNAIDIHGLKIGIQAYANAELMVSYESHDTARGQKAKATLTDVNQKLSVSVNPSWQAINSGWWGVQNSNWNLVCNSSLIIGALVARDTFGDDATKVEKYAIESLQGTGYAEPRLHGKGPFSEFSADGAYAEGPGYSSYASSYAVSVISTLFHAEGNDHGLLEANPGLLKLGAYWRYYIGPTGWLIAFSDVGVGPAESPSSIQWFGDQLLTGLLHDPDSKQDAQALLYHDSTTKYDDPLRLLYYAPLPDPRLSLPLDASFPALPSVIFRSAWNDPNATCLAAYGGDNTANHAHLEMGNFLLDFGGTRLVYTFGFENYALQGNGDEAVKRWEIMRNSTEGQNTLLLSDMDHFPTEYMFEDGFSNQSLKGRGVLSNFHSSSSAGTATFDLSSGYLRQNAPQKVLRQFTLDGPNRSVVSVEDTVTPTGSTNYKFQAYIAAAAKVRIAEDGQTATLTVTTNAGGAQMGKQVLVTVRIRSSSKATLLVESAKPTDYATVPPAGVALRQNANANYQRLGVYMPNLPAGQTAKVLVQFLPTAAAAAVPMPNL